MEAGEKDKAFDTPFRYSANRGCSRQLALKAAGFEQTNPMDVPGLVVTNDGTLRHELVQDAISTRFPGAQFELPSQIDGLISGHCDALIPWNDRLYLWELKNRGASKFDTAQGVDRRFYRMKEVGGPSLDAVTQGGLNALALGADEVVIAYISVEALSMQIADKLNLGNLDRIMLEWLIPRQVWEPLALEELNRLRSIKEFLDRDLIPAATAPGDDGELEHLNPSAARRHWRCWYCSHRDLCEALPRGAVKVELARTIANPTPSEVPA